MANVGTTHVRTADDVMVHVLADEAGGRSSAPPVLLVHGLASNARLWDGVRGRLAAQGHAVAAVDLRGHGQSSKPDDGYDFATISDDLVAVLDSLGWPAAVLAGQSWGGNVVLELAARAPERVEAVVCVDGGWMEFWRWGTWDQVRERLAPPKTEGTPVETMRERFRWMHPDWSDEAIEGALACFEVRADHTVAPLLTRERHLLILHELWKHHLDEVLPLVNAPVVLVACEGGSSATTDRKREEVARAEQLLRRSRTLWVNASHDVHAERPGFIADVIHGAAAGGQP